MKVVVLAGGLGTRLAEETQVIPKPMVQIGGKPILWHIMSIYAHHGFKEFVLALGYKSDVIIDYFIRYQTHHNDITVDLRSGALEVRESHGTDWQVRMIDTGVQSQTGGRLGRLEPVLRSEGTFMMTYGDGVANVDLAALLDYHRRHGKIATLTAVRPPARFGTVLFDGDCGQVSEFREKSQTSEGWINGGFFVFESGVFDYLHGDEMVLEREPLERLAADSQLMAYRHEGFWQGMDTLRDRNRLDELWSGGRAPWAVWQQKHA